MRGRRECPIFDWFTKLSKMGLRSLLTVASIFARLSVFLHTIHKPKRGSNMAGGPIFPHSIFPVTASRVFPNFHVGAGANSKQDEGLGVEASVGADSIWRLRFQMPPDLTGLGTGKLRLRALADAVAGAAKVDPQWASVAVEEDPSSAALNAEGTSTITWGAGDDDVYKELLIDLDADVLVANEEVVMDLVFETAAWTLAQISTWIASIIWE